jgi:hypothetical protein
LEGALYQIDGGSLDAKHLSEKFLRQPDVIASNRLLHWRSHLAALLST